MRFSIKKIKRIQFIRKKKKFKNIFVNILLIAIIIMIITLLLFLSQKNLFSKIILLKNKIKGLKICQCGVGKKENLYIREYISYYKKLGYNHIFIYDNNDIEEERFEEVIQDEIDSGFATVINIRGIKGKEDNSPQCIAFKDCYEKNNKKYDWLSFFDLDEFLEVRPKSKNIQDYLNNKRFENCEVVKINFLFYSDNELLYYDNRTLQERFTTPLYKHQSNSIVKVIARGGLSKNYWSVNCTPHTSKFKCANCDSSGKKIKFKTFVVSPPKFEYASLKHYYTKSLEDYVIKCIRGSAYAKVKWNNERKKMKIGYYFLYNKRTPEKEKLIKEWFNMSSSKKKVL